jgi:hypothetical protein
VEVALAHAACTPDLTTAMVNFLSRSSAVEVALKMALRAYVAAHPNAKGCPLEVVGSAEGYHGDTLGCMDAVAPSVYNGPRQTPWCGSYTLPWSGGCCMLVSGLAPLPASSPFWRLLQVAKHGSCSMAPVLGPAGPSPVQLAREKVPWMLASCWHWESCS